MNETVQLAKANNVLVGAHPSLPDQQGWGRREMAMEPVCRSCISSVSHDAYGHSQDELASCFIYQVGALTGFLQLHGVRLNHVSWAPPLLRAVTFTDAFSYADRLNPMGPYMG